MARARADYSDPLDPLVVEARKKAARSFLRRYIAPWPKTPSGEIDVSGVDLLMGDGASAIRGLLETIKAMEAERQ
ncbi:hypothetical protein NO932_11650 [Pelagibacterium sp. 26DY04]|uniref:hypothetical protein n=1 Tax=Pelagibacterium sp. 26DY04 TaxID=2967130 RepID=UPI0028153624|nr:hypothetical protein [Pelagibacterium sp. 26DY04]WMT85582.1 hypothetical protein NO932_11650 [Pelagibacterium sp. 26DY04]